MARQIVTGSADVFTTLWLCHLMGNGVVILPARAEEWPHG